MGAGAGAAGRAQKAWGAPSPLNLLQAHGAAPPWHPRHQQRHALQLPPTWCPPTPLPSPCLCHQGTTTPVCASCTGRLLKKPTGTAAGAAPAGTDASSSSSSSSLLSFLGFTGRAAALPPQHRHCPGCKGIFCMACTEGESAPNALLGASAALSAALERAGAPSALCSACAGARLLSGKLSLEAAAALQAALLGLPLP